MMWKVLILAIALVIGIIHGVWIEPSFNILVSWIFIGLWLAFTVKVFQKNKQHKEYNSPHNTSFFILAPLLVGLIFAIWSNFTGLFGDNFFNGSYVSLSWWSLVFGLPYIIYGSSSLYRMFKKYPAIYFGTKSVGARGFGFFTSFLVIFIINGYWIFFYVYLGDLETLLNPIYLSVDLILIIMLANTGLLIIITGFFGKKAPLPPLTSDYLAARRRRISESPRPQVRSVTTPTPRARSSQSRARSSTSRPRPRASTASRATAQSRARQAQSKSSSKTQKPKVQRPHYERYKPKGVNLTTEDFKCIFCFELPTPSDKGRGIVLCPNCKRPSHLDEFKDWTKSSSLCSRCEFPLPIRYMNDPKVIPIKIYVEVIKKFTS